MPAVLQVGMSGLFVTQLKFFNLADRLGNRLPEGRKENCDYQDIEYCPEASARRHTFPPRNDGDHGDYTRKDG
jgi:hypothetical protein